MFNTLYVVTFILFSSYLVLLIWLIIKTPFFKKLPVPTWVLVGLFLIKVAAGIYYGWFFTHMPNYKVQADTWRLFYESQVETAWFKNDPVAFIADLFMPRHQQASGGILATSNSYWNDIKSVLIVKLMALCNLLTGSRYYVNVLFFEYLSFWGPVALSRLFINYFPSKKWYIIAGAFLFPSTLLWCSGFHKEGLLFTSLAMATWLVHKCVLNRTLYLRPVLLVLFHLFIVFLLRNYLVAFFLLWCIPWFATFYLPKYQLTVFLITSILAVGLFFSTSSLKPLPNLPQKLADRQREFLQISGESLIQSDSLQPTVTGYAKALPSAIVNGFFQPLFFSVKKASYIPAIAEIGVFFLLIMNTSYVVLKRYSLVFGQKNINKYKISLLLFCIFFSASVFLLVGYIIPYIGAIVRYKAVAWPFIILPMSVVLPEFKLNIIKKNIK